MVFSKRWHGASRFEVMAVVAFLGILATVLLNRLAYYEELAEKAHMESKASAIKNALRIQMSLLLIQGRAQEYASLAQQNPLDWLESKTAKGLDLGMHAVPDRALAGSWRFDPASRTLVYLVQHGDYFAPDSTGQKQVRWQVQLIRDGSKGNGAASADLVVGVTLKLVEPYRWF